MRKVLIVTNIITVVVLVFVLLYSQWQSTNAKLAYNDRVYEITNLQNRVASYEKELQRLNHLLDVCRKSNLNENGQK
jgi:cell division protein FtsL